MKWASLIVSNSNVIYDSFALGGGFSIPVDQHLFINDLIVTFGNAQGELQMLWDQKTQNRDADKFQQNTIVLVANVQTNATIQLKNLDIDIFSEIRFVGIAFDFEITFGYEFRPGPMNYGIAIADLLQDLRKIGQPLTSAGGEFDILGDFKQLGVEN